MTGVVLVGGLSSRLGLDKTRLRLHGLDRPSLLERTVALLQEHVDEVVLSCRSARGMGNEARADGNGASNGSSPAADAPEADWEGTLRHVRRVADRHPGIGPLGGLHACLAELPGPLLVLSCDLPFMDHAVLERLTQGHASRPADALMTTFQQIDTGYIEALVSIYESACLPFFESALDQGIRQLNLVIPANRRHHLPYGQEQALPFFNVNYPSDLALAKQVIKPS